MYLKQNYMVCVTDILLSFAYILLIDLMVRKIIKLKDLINISNEKEN